MFRLSGLLMIAMATVFGALLFLTSQSVQRSEQDLSKISQTALQEEESLRVLSAEWDYLNRPQRLEKLAQDNFDLDAKSATDLGVVDNVKAIPEPRIPAIPKIKPKNLMQYVSTQKQKSKTSEKPDVIQNTDRQNFDKLLENITEGRPR